MNRFSLQGMRSIKENELPEIDSVLERFPERKRRHLHIRDFLRDSINIIAEIKKSSPSLGDINRETDIRDQMNMYIEGGASGISVLTEKNYFGGSLESLGEISPAINVPVLCKDFVYFDKQIDAAEKLGADLVLLIVKSLGMEEMERLYFRSLESGLTPLVEVHEYSEFEKIRHLNPEVVLVNMRNLETLEILYEVGTETLKKIPDSVIRVSASGINSSADIKNILRKTGVNNFLVGTSLMKNGDPAELLREFKNVS